ncbi:MAG: hypothetical protein ACI828_002091 [Flavobacteriales bacterium]|jgi:hypothetical protein
MESAKVDQLLERYFEGDTTVTEEQQLRAYFTSTQVASHLDAYVGMFSAFAKAQEDTFTAPISIPSKKRNLSWMASAAAVVLITVGIVAQMQPDKVSGHYEDNPELAVLKAKQSLILVSRMFNQSTAQLGAVKAFDNAPSTFFK